LRRWLLAALGGLGHRRADGLPPRVRGGGARHRAREAPLPLVRWLAVQGGVDVVEAVDAEELERLARRTLEREVPTASHHDHPVAHLEVLRRVRDHGDRAGVVGERA